MNCLKNLDYSQLITTENTVSPIDDLNCDRDSYIEPDDINLYLTVVCKLHPGLEFLRPTPDFQISYVETCI